MKISEQIIEVLDALCERFGIAIDWTNENVIPYITMLCKKLVTYEIVTSIAGILLCAIIAIATIIIFKKLLPTFKTGMEKEKNSWSEDWLTGFVFFCVGCAISLFVCFYMASVQITDIMKCITFPELYVFEYIQNLIQ
jgi:hypothetical protein